jgi:FAD synthase
MGLAEALSEIPEARPNLRCKIARLRDELDSNDVAAFNQALEAVYSQPRSVRMGRQHGATATWLAKTLTANGYPITDGTIQRHIRGECSCGTL